jgi:bifunctional DNA-binding transcriptional regulator/antitoxin component of YhaV-PrlF toxin-antitoxin module
MTKKVIERNNNIFIPIPKNIGRHVGIESGSYVKVTDDGYRIIITPKAPKEEEFTEEELHKLVSLKKEKGKTFKSGKAMIKHLRGLMKK